MLLLLAMSVFTDEIELFEIIRLSAIIRIYPISSFDISRLDAADAVFASIFERMPSILPVSRSTPVRPERFSPDKLSAFCVAGEDHFVEAVLRDVSCQFFCGCCCAFFGDVVRNAWFLKIFCFHVFSFPSLFLHGAAVIGKRFACAGSLADLKIAQTILKTKRKTGIGKRWEWERHQKKEM